ncbi:exported protein of unknown function [Ralstonia solanacearum CMR15]|nr:exported protein of unknown function [Ralstonia solanacearum CMR15]
MTSHSVENRRLGAAFPLCTASLGSNKAFPGVVLAWHGMATLPVVLTQQHKTNQNRPRHPPRAGRSL